jgi:hypothetical protein
MGDVMSSNSNKAAEAAFQSDLRGAMPDVTLTERSPIFRYLEILSGNLAVFLATNFAREGEQEFRDLLR